MKGFGWRRIFKVQSRPSSITQHYLEHKATARARIMERLTYWNQFYGYTWQRVTIRNQRWCWGSCSSKGNLNFSYKLLFLPPCLSDYIIVHELCHLAELNHGERFWALVAQQVPDYRERQGRLRQLERTKGITARTLEAQARIYCCGTCGSIVPDNCC